MFSLMFSLGTINYLNRRRESFPRGGKRQVFPNGDVARLWINQSQESARNPQHNFYFEGDTIYSHGSHFPIARIAGDAVLFTIRTYSNTTARHLGDVRSALYGNHRRVFMVRDPRLDLTAQVRDFDQRIKDLSWAVYGPTGRFRPNTWGALESLIESANEFAAWCNVPTRWELPVNREALRRDVRGIAEHLGADISLERREHVLA